MKHNHSNYQAGELTCSDNSSIVGYSNPSGKSSAPVLRAIQLRKTSKKEYN
jgi:hypothetical protein